MAHFLETDSESDEDKNATTNNPSMKASESTGIEAQDGDILDWCNNLVEPLTRTVKEHMKAADNKNKQTTAKSPSSPTTAKKKTATETTTKNQSAGNKKSVGTSKNAKKETRKPPTSTRMVRQAKNAVIENEETTAVTIKKAKTAIGRRNTKKDTQKKLSVSSSTQVPVASTTLNQGLAGPHRQQEGALSDINNGSSNNSAPATASRIRQREGQCQKDNASAEQRHDIGTVSFDRAEWDRLSKPPKPLPREEAKQLRDELLRLFAKCEEKIKQDPEHKSALWLAKNHKFNPPEDQVMVDFQTRIEVMACIVIMEKSILHNYHPTQPLNNTKSIRNETNDDEALDSEGTSDDDCGTSDGDSFIEHGGEAIDGEERRELEQTKTSIGARVHRSEYDQVLISEDKEGEVEEEEEEEGSENDEQESNNSFVVRDQEEEDECSDDDEQVRSVEVGRGRKKRTNDNDSDEDNRLLFEDTDKPASNIKTTTANTQQCAESLRDAVAQCKNTNQQTRPGGNISGGTATGQQSVSANRNFYLSYTCKGCGQVKKTENTEQTPVNGKEESNKKPVVDICLISEMKSILPKTHQFLSNSSLLGPRSILIPDECQITCFDFEFLLELSNWQCPDKCATVLTARQRKDAVKLTVESATARKKTVDDYIHGSKETILKSLLKKEELVVEKIKKTKKSQNKNKK